MATAREDNLVTVVIGGSALLLFALCLASLAFFSRRETLGVLMGGLVGIANFLWMRGMLARLLARSPSRPAQRAAFGFLARMTVITLVICPPLASGHVSPIALLTGLSVIVLAILLLSLHDVLQQRRGGA